MASKTQLLLTAQTLRWNIVEMLELEQQLESDARNPETRRWSAKRLEFLKRESLQRVDELKIGLDWWSRGVTVPPSSTSPKSDINGSSQRTPSAEPG